MIASRYLAAIRRRLQSALQRRTPAFVVSLARRRRLARFRAFLMFVNFGRCGSTLLGTMLNAHPDIALAHEVGFLLDISRSDGKSRYRAKGRDATLRFLIERAAQNRRGYALRMYFGDAFVVDNPSLRLLCGHPPPRIIGDKTGRMAAEAIFRHRALEALREVDEAWRLNPMFISVVRNPYDMVTTQVLRDLEGRLSGAHGSARKVAKLSELAADRRYACDIESLLDEHLQTLERRNRATRQALESRYPLTVVHYEDLTTAPRAQLRRVLAFLNLPCPAAYLDACARLAGSARQSRHLLVDFWTRNRRDEMRRIRDRYEWLQRYSFDD